MGERGEVGGIGTVGHGLPYGIGHDPVTAGETEMLLEVVGECVAAVFKKDQCANLAIGIVPYRCVRRGDCLLDEVLVGGMGVGLVPQCLGHPVEQAC